MIIFDQTLLLVLISTTLVSISCGIIGTFVVLQQQSLCGDAIAHATLPGIALIFLLTKSKNSWILLLGAIISGLFAFYLITMLHKHTNLKKDSILGIILASFFGLGALLLSVIQRNPNAHQAGINKFLWGNPATMLFEDLALILCITFIILLVSFLYKKDFQIVIFDSKYAHTLGINTHKIFIILSIITTLAIVIGLQTVGIILICSLLVAPAAAAFQLTHSFSQMIKLSCLFSLISTISGILLSSNFNHLATGPTIVVIATSITFIALFYNSKINSK